jgi:hypothetical protein
MKKKYEDMSPQEKKANDFVNGCIVLGVVAFLLYLSWTYLK